MQERREFFRVKFDAPVRFKTADHTASGIMENISPSGILFQTVKTPPQLSSILWLDLDLRTLEICREIERNALILNNGLLGKVVRVEEAPSAEGYQVGVCFLTKDQKDARDVRNLLNGAVHS